jgi:NADH dehydrogenase
VTPRGIYIGDEFIPVHTVFWAAGVKASPLGRSLGVATDRAGRVIVGPDLTIPNHPEVFVVGDLAAAITPDTGEQVPGLAQAGIQMGRFAGETISNELLGRSSAGRRRPFVYRNKGIMAVIGKSKAVVEIGKFKFGGFFAWLLWGGVHIVSLIGFRNRVQVMLSWLWNWFLNARDARLITGEAKIHEQVPPAAFVHTDTKPGAEKTGT